MGFSKPDSFERLDSVKGRASSSAGVSRSARGERTDAHKVKGLSHHGHPQATTRGQILSTVFSFVVQSCPAELINRSFGLPGLPKPWWAFPLYIFQGVI